MASDVASHAPSMLTSEYSFSLFVMKAVPSIRLFSVMWLLQKTPTAVAPRVPTEFVEKKEFAVAERVPFPILKARLRQEVNLQFIKESLPVPSEMTVLKGWPGNVQLLNTADVVNPLSVLMAQVSNISVVLNEQQAKAMP